MSQQNLMNDGLPAELSRLENQRLLDNSHQLVKQEKDLHMNHLHQHLQHQSHQIPEMQPLGSPHNQQQNMIGVGAEQFTGPQLQFQHQNAQYLQQSLLLLLQIQFQQQKQQQQQQQTSMSSNAQLMASPMVPNGNNSSLNQSSGAGYPASYQQNLLQYFQYQQQYFQYQQQYQQQQQQQQQLYQNLQQPNNGVPAQVYVPQVLSSFNTPSPGPLPGAATSAPIPIAAAITPNGSNPFPASMNMSQRKRQRRSDHAQPGDEGDSELKEMAYKSLEMPFEEFAAQVRLVENGSNSSRMSSPVDRTLKEEDYMKERKRQVFAMVCLIKSCKVHPKSVVPRNRVYAMYVTVCANNGVIPLSAASFGKLVRILYPSLITRRLGMRGLSKYHYCGIELVGDDSPYNSPKMQTPIGSPFTTPRTSNSLEGGAANSPLSMGSRTSSIANVNQSFVGTSHSSTPSAIDTDFKNFITPNLKFDLQMYHNIKEFHQRHEQKQLQDQQHNQEHDEQQQQQPLFDMDFKCLEFPPLSQCLPEKYDIDIATTLESLYKSHCCSIFESLRYLQLKRLLNTVSSFAFSLTSPVYKLYVSEPVQHWAIECDTIVYQSFMRLLAKFALKKIPAHVSQQLRFIVKNYSENYLLALKKLPTEFTKLKLRPVENFATLTSRLLKVSSSSLAASKVLSNSQERLKMLQDWIKCDFKEIIDKDVPCANPSYTDNIHSICTKEVPELLSFDPFLELNIDINDPLDDEFKFLQVHDCVMDRWTEFLIRLPLHFPNVPPRMFLLCLSSLLTTTLREMTLLEGESFGTWWLLRCWIDDWLGWIAELIGFLQMEVNSTNGQGMDQSQQQQSQQQKEHSNEQNCYQEESQQGIQQNHDQQVGDQTSIQDQSMMDHGIDFTTMSSTEDHHPDELSTGSKTMEEENLHTVVGNSDSENITDISRTNDHENNILADHESHQNTFLKLETDEINLLHI